jgi:hypothetical protein
MKTETFAAISGVKSKTNIQSKDSQIRRMPPMNAKDNAHIINSPRVVLPLKSKQCFMNTKNEIIGNPPNKKAPYAYKA